jgi:hypothetical protein
MTHAISAVCYGLVAAGAVIFGAAYVLRGRLMPYHEEAIGRGFGELDERLQTLLVAMLRVVGGEMLVCGLSLALLIGLSFRDGDAWTIWAMPLLALGIALPNIYATTFVRHRTGAHTPVGIAAAGLVLIVAGAVFSLI